MTGFSWTRPRNVVAIGVALAILPLASGCSDATDTGSPGARSPGTGAATSAPSTGAPWSTREAAEKFVEYIAPVNAATVQLQGLPPGAPVKDVNQACGAIAEAQATAATNLKTGRWPAAAVGPVNRLVDAIATDRAIWAACAGAADSAALEQAAAKFADLKSGAAAAAARSALGIATSTSSSS